MPDISWEHAAEARAALNAIVTDPEHGVAALSSAQTMSNLLKDYLPDAPREKSILVAAAEAGLADTLREHVAQGMDPSTAIRLTASSFSAATPFTPDACTWVAGELAAALGIGPADSGSGSGPAGQMGPGQVDPLGMPTQITPIPGFGSGPGKPTTPDSAQAQGQAYLTQTAPQAPPSPGQAYPAQGSPQAFPGSGPGAGYAPGGPGVAGYGGPAGAQPGFGGPAGAQPGYGGPAGAQPGFGGPAGGYGPGAPAGYGPGPAGYGPPGTPVPFRPGRPPGRSSGGKRGLLVGGGILIVIIVIIVIAAILSSKGTPSAHGSGSPGQSTSPTTTPTQTTTPPPSTGVESLNTIMMPSGLAPVGTSCQQAPLSGLNPATVTSRMYCTSTSINFVPTNQIVVWAYQFDSYSDYQARFAKVNSITGFKSAGAYHHCPPPTSTGYGSTTWFANHNPKYDKSHESGQYLECFVEYTKTHRHQPLLIWTMPSQYVVFISRNEAPGGSFNQLINWWNHVSYG